MASRDQGSGLWFAPPRPDDAVAVGLDGKAPLERLFGESRPQVEFRRRVDGPGVASAHRVAAHVLDRVKELIDGFQMNLRVVQTATK